jgi:DNA repair exonuclease SbcCD ATPase subunit
MSPSSTKKEILKQLRQTRNKMMSAAWIDAVREQTGEVRREAAFKRADIMDAIHELQNTELAEIRDKLIENETELLEGIAKLGQALENLENVKKVLNAAGKLLDIVAKVVKFVAIPV